MVNFIIIGIAFGFGVLAKNLKRFPASSAVSINQFVILISLPAMILAKLPPLLQSLEFSGNWWVAVSMPWLLFFLSWVIVGQIGSLKNWSSAKTGALILTCGLGNTSFVGFPLLAATLGEQAIPYGVLVDQLGSFLILATAGTIVAAIYSGGEFTLRIMHKRLFQFPPFLALIACFIWYGIGLPFENIFHEVFDKLSMTLVPLTLFSVGLQTHFNLNVIRRRWQPLVFGLCFKMVLMPAFFYFLYFKVLGFNDLLTQTTFLESAMATQITSAVVVAEYQLDVELANLMVSFSIPLSLLTVPLIHSFILAS